ncbi:FtsW/RodA/SpoVE family cell cycle protein [Pedomonas mirosovicensis]|uniref:FtsW/RodA/SpoVE family cell cycle protein n=1 Tax=Pedomonas mirosovicensis TaxID=2908641 RepID=UPI0021694067|nr:putative peptidoglycan glycosyltransferase FtsW [Pedomonas mirosovicensis]MCH8684668.1 putative lipid II flippase FtsW [Pedomonas mirosovicensis]
MIPFRRTDRTAVSRWFWTIDRILLGMLLLLISIGIVAVMSASPAAAHRYSGGSVRLNDMMYFQRHLFWVGLGIPVMIATSLLPIQWIRRLCVVGFLFFLAALMAVPLVGSDANGAVRWISLGGFQFQPSEFLKPAFIVTTAWILSARYDDSTVPAFQVAAGLLVLVIGFLVIQPDYGQSALILFVWFAQALLAGLNLYAFGTMAVAGLSGMGLAYLFVPHVQSRIDRFIFSEGDTYQADKAMECFQAGGLFGTGPGQGLVKMQLPEPHTDYIFAVIGEEFGMLACLGLAILYLGIIVRVLLQLVNEDDPFIVLSVAGLTTQFGAQAFINMGVNLHLLPSKGMTLPFISHGGSSFIATAMTMGLVLALTRRNRFLDASPFVAGRAA